MNKSTYAIPGIFLILFGALWMNLNKGDSLLNPEMLISMAIIIFGVVYIFISIKGAELNRLIPYSVTLQFLALGVFIFGIIITLLACSIYKNEFCGFFLLFFAGISLILIAAGFVSFILGLIVWKREISKVLAIVLIIIITILALITGYIIFWLS
jgi:hypothetical protein